MKELILQKIPTECPWRDTLYWYESIDSTNNQAKRLAAEGAPHGTVLIAGHQTGGRGRMGREFQSPASEGVYLSVILRPGCPPAELMHLTCAVGVAMADAIEQTAGFRPGIKWINDLVWGRKKLGGILTELSIDSKTGLTEYAIVGVGINCTQAANALPPQIRQIATSLSVAADKPVAPEDLAAKMVVNLHRMDCRLFSEKAALLHRYRRDCVTLGQQVMVLRGEEKRPGTALAMDDNGALTVRYAGGVTETVNSGEVSVRGFYDYI